MITNLKSHLLTGKKLLTLLLFVFMMGEMVGQKLSVKAEMKRDSIIDFHRDSICAFKATIFINEKFGEKFVKKNVEYYSVSRANVGRVVFFKVKNHSCKEDKNIFPVFCFRDKWIVDSTKSIITKQEIINCKKDKRNCTLYIDRQGAYNILNKAGLKLEKVKFSIYFEMFGNRPTWVVQTGGYSKGGYGNGSTYEINCNTGKYEIGSWHSQP